MNSCVSHPALFVQKRRVMQDLITLDITQLGTIHGGTSHKDSGTTVHKDGLGISCKKGAAAVAMAGMCTLGMTGDNRPLPIVREATGTSTSQGHSLSPAKIAIK
jgi:hypothetical protein